MGIKNFPVKAGPCPSLHRPPSPPPLLEKCKKWPEFFWTFAGWFSSVFQQLQMHYRVFVVQSSRQLQSQSKSENHDIRSRPKKPTHMQLFRSRHGPVMGSKQLSIVFCPSSIVFCLVYVALLKHFLYMYSYHGHFLEHIFTSITFWCIIFQAKQGLFVAICIAACGTCLISLQHQAEAQVEFTVYISAQFPQLPNNKM